MKVSKQIVINIGNYQSLRLGVEDVPNYTIADAVITREINRLKLPVDQKIKQVLIMNNSE